MAQIQSEVRERQPLTRERILRAAVDVMDREGLDAVTMRRLGRELGCEAMSLYHHVRDKEALLVGIIETVMSEFRVPPQDGGEWIERLRALAVEFRRVLLEHPEVMRLISEHHGPPTSPDAFEPVEAALATLRQAGLSPEDTTHAYRALVGYVMGHVTLETGGLFAADRADHWADQEAFLRNLPEGRLPTMREMLPYVMGCDPHLEFEHGLDMLLAGLEVKLRGS